MISVSSDILHYTIRIDPKVLKLDYYFFLFIRQAGFLKTLNLIMRIREIALILRIFLRFGLYFY